MIAQDEARQPQKPVSPNGFLKKGCRVPEENVHLPRNNNLYRYMMDNGLV